MLLFQLFAFISAIMVLKNHHLSQNHVALGAVFILSPPLLQTGEQERQGGQG